MTDRPISCIAARYATYTKQARKEEAALKLQQERYKRAREAARCKASQQMVNEAKTVARVREQALMDASSDPHALARSMPQLRQRAAGDDPSHSSAYEETTPRRTGVHAANQPQHTHTHNCNVRATTRVARCMHTRVGWRTHMQPDTNKQMQPYAAVLA